MVTPIYAVYLITQKGTKKHFANFYGQTINNSKGLNQKEAEDESQKNDVEIFGMIKELEQKIKIEDLKKIKKDLFVEVNWVQLGDFVHKDMAKMDDSLYCSTVERAFILLKKAYEKIGQSEKQILEEKLNLFKKSLNAMDDLEL